MQSSNSSRSAAHVSIGAILDAIGSDALRLVNNQDARHHGVSQRTLYDAFDELPKVTDGLLFAAGTKVGPDLLALLPRAVAAGYTVVMVKHDGRAPIEEPVGLADRLGIALVTVEPAVDWLQLEHLIGTAFAGASASVNSALSSLAVGDLFSLANAIAAATGGATAIEDMDARILAYSTVPNQYIDAARQDGILGRAVPDFPDNVWHYRQVYSNPAAVRLPESDAAGARIACAVRSGARVIGSVWVIDGGNLHPDAARLLEEACEIAALHMLRARAAEDFARQRRSDLVRSLLETEDAAAAHQLGLTSQTPIWVAAVEPISTVNTETRTLSDPERLVDVLTLELAARAAQSGCVVLGGRVYVVLAWTEGARPDRLLYSVVRVASLAVKAELRAGLAGPVDGPAGVRALRADADQVLALLAAHPDSGPVATADDVRDALTIRWLGQRLEVGEVSGLAHRILQEDADRGTDTARLLLTWLGTLGDVRRAAVALAVHPNTVRYRLSRLQTLHGLQVDSPDQLLLLWLALRLAKEAGKTA